MTNDEWLTSIVADLSLILRHVASQPWGYGGWEVDRAKLLLHTVDVAALADTLNSVLFVSWLLKKHGPLSATEQQVEAAAMRLDRLQRSIRLQQSEIQARMAA